MKNLFSLLIISSFTLYLTSCDKAEIQPTATTVETRTDCVDECEDCPIDDCCCSITLTEGTQANLTFCGVSDPCLSTNACYAEAGTCIISGYELYATLANPGNLTELFCVRKNRPFYILSNNPVSARITCQNGYLNPQTVNVTFNTPPNNKAYFTVNGSCEIASCF